MKQDEIDTVLHPPARLQIAAVLAKADEIEFATLKNLIGVSDSVMSKHLSALSDANYVTLAKAARDGRQRTWVRSTSTGRKAFAAHMRALHALVEKVQDEIVAQ